MSIDRLARLQTAVYVAAISFHTWLFVTTDGWVRWLNGVFVGVLIAVHFTLVRRRQDVAAALHDLRWDIAASSNDPIGSLAVMDYMDGLDCDQLNEVLEWMAEWSGQEVPIEDLPPLVLGLVLAANPEVGR